VTLPPRFKAGDILRIQYVDGGSGAIKHLFSEKTGVKIQIQKVDFHNETYLVKFLSGNDLKSYQIDNAQWSWYSIESYFEHLNGVELFLQIL
jgi:hypothetical protein